MLFSTRIKNPGIRVNFALIIFLCALSLSAFIRFKPVFEGTFPFLYDHGRDFMDVKKIVEDGNFTFIGPTTGVIGIYHGPLHYYILAVGYLLSGGHPASGVVMTILAHLLAGIACFVLGSKFIDRRFGLLLSVIFLLSLSSIRTSIIFWNPYWIPPLMVFFYFALLAAMRISSIYWLLVGLIAGLIAQFEIAFGVFLIPFLFFAAFLSEKKVFTNRYFWLSFPVFGIPFLPMVAFDIKHGFLMFKTAYSVMSGTYVGPMGDSIPFLLRAQYRFGEVWRMSFESFSPQVILNYLLLAICVGFLVYIVVERKKEALHYSSLFLLLPFVLYVGFMFYSKPAWTYYWVGIQVSFYFFFAYVLYYLTVVSRKFIVPVGIFIFLFSTAILTDTFKKTDFIAREPGIYINQIRIIDTIYRDAAGKPFGVLVYTPPIYDHTYQYLFYWCGKQMGFIPDQSTNGVYYLIIEEDRERPQLRSGWRISKAGNKQPVWSETFPGSITVEKYIHE